MIYYAISAGRRLIQYIRTDGINAYCFAVKDKNNNKVAIVERPLRYKLQIYLKGCNILGRYKTKKEFLVEHFAEFL